MIRNPETWEVDWSELHRRLEQIRKEYEASLEPSPEAETAVLRTRAHAAAAIHYRDPLLNSEGALLFTAGEEQYSISTRYVWEVCRTGHVAQLPMAPPHLVGVTNLKGLILPLIDLRSLLGSSGDGIAKSPYFLVVGATMPELCIMADALRGLTQLRTSDLAPLPRTGKSASRSLMRGLTSDGTLVLDAVSLLQDPRLNFGSTPS